MTEVPQVKKCCIKNERYPKHKAFKKSPKQRKHFVFHRDNKHGTVFIAEHCCQGQWELELFEDQKTEKEESTTYKYF